MILLKDGVKYNIWTPEKELYEFEPMIKYHVKDIFGDGCEYFSKTTIETIPGISRIPDGFIINFENRKWYIVELKLLCDDAINRIGNQITDYKEINKKNQLKVISTSIKNQIENEKRKSLVSEIIFEKEPEIIVIINSLNGEKGVQFQKRAKEADKIIEFKTYARDNVDPRKVHVHLFEPLYKYTLQKLEKYWGIKKTEVEEIAEKYKIKGEKIIPMGARGDQIIRVIDKMKDSKNYNTAVKEVAKELNITYQSVADKCGRQLTGSSKDFVKMVEEGTIYDYLYKKGVIKTH